MRLFLVVILIVFINSPLFSQEENLKEEKIEKMASAFSGANPGMSIAIINSEKVLFSKSYGVANVESEQTLNEDLKMNISSLGKYITALCIFELVDRNKVKFTDNLNDIFPDFPSYGEKITIKNLLNHTSGLTSYSNNIKTNKEILEFIKNQNETIFEPGTKFEYSNSDYPLLVSVIEKVSKKSYQNFFKKYIAKKLKFKEPVFYSEINHNEIARGHIKKNTSYKVNEDKLSTILGEHNIYMSAFEYVNFVKLLYSQKLMDQKVFNEFFTCLTVSDGKYISYNSAGWSVMKRKELRYMWQAGTIDGYTHMVLHLPDDNISVILFTNRNDSYGLLKGAFYIANLYTERDVQQFFK